MNIALNMATLWVLIAVLLCVDADSSGHRAKRHTEASSLNILLQHFLGRFARMESMIRQQEKSMKNQLNEIRYLRWLLMSKGTEERLNEVRSDIRHEKIQMKDAATFKPLTDLTTRYNLLDGKLKVLSQSVSRDYKSMHDIYDRVLIHKKLTCRKEYTSYHPKASDMIGSLSRHSVTCHRGEMLQGFLFQREDGRWEGRVRYQYWCCRINIKDKWQAPPK